MPYVDFFGVWLLGGIGGLGHCGPVMAISLLSHREGSGNTGTVTYLTISLPTWKNKKSLRQGMFTPKTKNPNTAGLSMKTTSKNNLDRIMM